MKKIKSFDDLQLWKKLLEGDINSLKIIYNQYVNDLYNYGRRFTNDDDLLKDCIHDIFVEIYNKRNNLGQTDNILFYLLKALRRKILKELTKKNRKIVIEDEYVFEYFDYSEIIESFVDHEDFKLIKRKLRNALDNLTPRQKEALYLKYIFEMDYEDICELMNMNYQSIRNLVCRAINSLREIMNNT